MYNPSGMPLGGDPWPAHPAAPGQGWPAQPIAPARSTKSVLGGVVALVGAVLTIVGVFSGWVTLDPGSNSETVTAWSMTAGDGLLKSNDPYVLVGLAVLAGVLAVLLFAGVARTFVRIVTVVTGLGIVGVVAYDWSSIASFVNDHLPSTFQASSAIGLYLAVAGGVLVAIAGLLPAKK